MRIPLSCKVAGFIVLVMYITALVKIVEANELSALITLVLGYFGLGLGLYIEKAVVHTVHYFVFLRR